MKALRVLVREMVRLEVEKTFLNESRKQMEGPIDKRILKQAYKLREKAGHIFIKDSGGDVVITLNIGVKYQSSLDYDSEGMRKVKKEIIDRGDQIGKLEIRKQDVSNEKTIQSRDKSKKNALGVKVGGSSRKNIWTVVFSEIDENNNRLGVGPIMYEVGIEYISRFKNCAVMSHEYISEEAFNVWKKFDERQDFEKYQLDVDVDNFGIHPKFGEKKPVQLTPDDDTDDIYLNLHQVGSRGGISDDDLLTNWSSSPLTRAFFNNKGRVIKFLHSENMISKI